MDALLLYPSLSPIQSNPVLLFFIYLFVTYFRTSTLRLLP